MNVSGEPVALLLAKKEIKPEKMLVIYDDMDIPLGRIRISAGGGSSGHKGVESIITNVAFANFARLRVGIGKDTRFESRQYVLSGFRKDEKKKIEKAVELSVSAVKFLLENGVRKAMNEFNGQNIASLNEIANTKT
jgi:PTH1 family peptidyl-tRNA hydrolase